MGFFKTVYTLCTRTSAFPGMLGTPVWKAILHSILLALLCPLCIATVQTCRAKKEYAPILQRLEQTSGGFGYRGNDMCFGGSFQERHYTFELFESNMRLDYVTARKELMQLKPDNWKEQNGLLITKKNAIFWTKTPDLAFLYWEVPADILKACLSPGAQNTELTSKLYSITQKANAKARPAAALLNAAAETLPPEEKTSAQTASPEAPFEEQDPAYISTVLFSLFWMFLFMQFLAEGILLFALGGLCFAFMEFLYLRMMPGKLPFRKVYMLTLYAMFPALIVASLATLLGQTFLDFQTVFLIAFFIYQLYSFKILGAFLNPPDRRQKNDFPEDDNDF